ncbi:MAG TPA: HD domain-containing protein, partial [Isosphaeraceae bacterium]|nr:HD domain-containing protein [Isosphaeraceae bacterium]
MADPHRTYEIRCPIHGFITISDWEREIIALKPFQRLRRIRQLAWTDQVYPGAMHTRFEHSLGVMHTATLLYDSVVQRSREVLGHELGYIEAGLERHRALVRLAALLHDVGHGPFSHASEDLFPEQGSGSSRFKHEHYSAAIVRKFFSDVIKNHPLNANYDFDADQVADLLEGKSTAGRALFWRELIDGQMDADRMDYLLRDSLHAGVQYGRFDLQRLIRSVAVVPPGGDDPEGGPRLGVSEGGWHAAESLILARYFMFTQVYYHKTRVAYNYHLEQALGEVLPDGLFPSPLGERLDDYLRWDDWRVLGLLAGGGGGEHGQRLATRDHFREVFHTPEIPSQADLERFTFGLQTERIPEERIADATEVGAEGDCHGALLEGSSRAGRGGG